MAFDSSKDEKWQKQVEYMAEIYKIEEDKDYKIEQLEQENARLNAIINNIADYVNKMGFGSIVDNPKKDLVKILRKEE